MNQLRAARITAPLPTVYASYTCSLSWPTTKEKLSIISPGPTTLGRVSKLHMRSSVYMHGTESRIYTGRWSQGRWIYQDSSDHLFLTLRCNFLR